MHAVILAAGEGSRLGETADVPKAFTKLDGETLYGRQRRVVDAYADAVTVVLGYQYERVIDDVGSARAVVVEDWADYENAESLRAALDGIDDDVLVLNGDILLTERAVDDVVSRHRAEDGDSVVAGLPGVQSEHTALRCDDDGLVTEYGLIEGHRHAGFGVLDRSHVDAAAAHLRRNRSEWYPVIYPEIETKLVAIPPTHHVEINRPRDKREAQRRLPLPASATEEQR